MRKRNHWNCKDGHYSWQEGCENCKWAAAEVRYYTVKEICPRCSEPITQAQYFGTTKQGSPHFRGTCSKPTFYPATIPEPTPYRINWQAIGRVNYKNNPGIKTYADLAKWWGLPTVGEAKPEETVEQWITAHPEIEYANKQAALEAGLAIA